MQVVMLIAGVLLVVYSFYSFKKNNSNYSGELFIFGVIIFIWGVSIREEKEYSYSSPTFYDIDSSRSFNGYPCTNDCSGHKAGYEWAEKNGISSTDDCDGKSDSFNEGCSSFSK